ncbi:hypothetical protein [Winogradskyella haliclonae]|uniref:DUF3784 domain-containing protein n=1 Tax=Winogradskyella haliclonae TaxID=2048558 RepID=A0ABQ2C0P2_9FLAO|nr:hypothetical protein [Winogradskyella haliclonae]GGI56693.1 hypothetical protein GCM10011444_10020 [Winogradskyella haliclonae]
MAHKKDIIIGFFVGIIAVLIGIFFFDICIGIYKGSSFNRIINRSFSTTLLDKRASIGVLINLPIFYLFLNKKKEDIAKGVLLATILVGILFLINKL